MMQNYAQTEHDQQDTTPWQDIMDIYGSESDEGEYMKVLGIEFDAVGG